MHGADQAGLVRDDGGSAELELPALGLEQNRRAPDRQFADTARPQAAANRDPPRPPPLLQLEEAADHRRKLLRELFHGRDDQTGRLGIALGQQLVQPFLADLAARLLAQRIVSHLPQPLAPAVEDGVERPLAGTVTHKAVAVPHLDAVGVDLQGGKPGYAMLNEGRVRDRCCVGHDGFPGDPRPYMAPYRFSIALQRSGNNERGYAAAYRPPLTSKICPVTKSASGLAKNTTALAISCALPKRRIGIDCTIACCLSGP